MDEMLSGNCSSWINMLKQNRPVFFSLCCFIWYILFLHRWCCVRITSVVRTHAASCCWFSYKYLQYLYISLNFGECFNCCKTILISMVVWPWCCCINRCSPNKFFCSLILVSWLFVGNKRNRRKTGYLLLIQIWIFIM